MISKNAHHRLEVDKIADLYVKGTSNTTENVNTDVCPATLKLPEIGAARARHERKLALRDVLVLAQLPYTVAKAPLLRFVTRKRSAWWLNLRMALYRKPFQLATEVIGQKELKDVQEDPKRLYRRHL